MLRLGQFDDFQLHAMLYYRFPDKFIILTVALDSDRTGHTYDSAIAPDQSVPVDMSQIGRPGDLALQAATTWLHDQEGCKG